jgi:hypothetical protein
MKHYKRKHIVSAFVAILLFLVPNFVQDYHRIWGHQENFCVSLTVSGIQIHEHHEKCVVCKFEFNIIEDIAFCVFAPSLSSTHCLFADKRENQIQQSAFHYYNLRAPPTT